jgi:hypothetical protein
MPPGDPSGAGPEPSGGTATVAFTAGRGMMGPDGDPPHPVARSDLTRPGPALTLEAGA